MKIAISPSSFAKVNSDALDVLKAAGCEFTLNPFGRKLTADEAIEHIRGADGLIAGVETLNAKVLESAPQLKAIARVGIGMSNVDVEAARQLGIKVSNTPDCPTEAVAELAMGALLGIMRNIHVASRKLHQGEWNKTIASGLEGAHVFVVGFGRIGRRMAEACSFWNAKVLVFDPFLDESVSVPKNYEILCFEEGLRKADVISLHASGETQLLGKLEFAQMKQGVVLLNCARGGLIDERALVDALDNGIVRSAWLDVFETEPYNGPLMQYEQVLLTPHIGTYSKQCRKNMEMEAVKNILRDLGIQE